MTWDERYRNGDHADLQPMPFLRALAERMSPGAQVLDLACGAGRHSVLFAEHECRVTAVDSSMVALDLLRPRNADVRCVASTAEDFEMADSSFDLVIVTMFLDRTLFPRLCAAVKPGGRVAMAIPLVDEREGVRPMNPAYLLHPGELAKEFRGWVCEHLVETSPDPPARRVAEIIAVRTIV